MGPSWGRQYRMLNLEEKKRKSAVVHVLVFVIPHAAIRVKATFNEYHMPYRCGSCHMTF